MKNRRRAFTSVLLAVATFVVCVMAKAETVTAQVVRPVVPEYTLQGIEYSVQYCAEVDMYAVYVNSINNTNKTIFYYHGGAYTGEITDGQYGFIAEIVKATDAEVIIPIYPLVPATTYQQAYAKVILQYCYWKVANPGREVYFLGDSAGGGMAVGLAQRLRDLNAPGPSKLILISPWVDLSMTNPAIRMYPDPSNGVETLRLAGKFWAGGLNPANGQVSVVNANCQNLPETLIIAGTFDFLYPDILRFKGKLEESGVSVHWYAAQNMCHDYPVLYPTLVPTEVQMVANFL